MPPRSASSDSISDHHHHHNLNLPSSWTTLNVLFLDSFIVLVSNPSLFSAIFLFLALPLSFLLSSLSLSSAPLIAQIRRLEALARLIHTRIEALNILDQAEGESLSLLRLRAAYAPPCLALSLLTLVLSAAAASTRSGKRGGRPTFGAVVAVFRGAWWRALATGLLAHAAAAGWAEVVRTVAGVAVGRAGVGVGVVVVVVGWASEVYLAAVLGVGMVVAVVEERWGVEALWVGWRLMEGRRICGWVMSGLVVGATICIGWEMEGMDGGDDRQMGTGWTAVMGYGWKGGLVCLLGLVVLWSNVAVTVYYCDCRKRHPDDWDVAGITSLVSNSVVDDNIDKDDDSNDV